MKWARIRFLLLCLGTVGGHAAWFLLMSPDPWVVGFGDLAERPMGTVLPLFGVQVLALGIHRLAAPGAAYRPRGTPTSAFVAVGLIHAVLATAVTPTPSTYPLHVLVSSAVIGLAWLSLSAAVRELERARLGGRIDAMLEWERAPWVAAIWAAVAALMVNRWVFDGIPHVPDEVVYLLQAKYLSVGELFVSGVPPAALDVISTVTHEGRWFGIFPVGWPAILAVGVRFGAPWAVNPLLTVGAILVAHGLVLRLWNRKVANVTAFLLGTSPWVIFLGGSLMSHTASILAALIALRGAVEVGFDRRRVGWSLIGGAALGSLVLIRPFEGVLVGLVCAGLVLGMTRSLVPALGSSIYAATALAVGGLTLLYNRALTGDPLLDPITLYFDGRHYPGVNRLGFGPDVGNVGWGNDALAGHSPFEALVNASLNVSLVQVELFGWAFGSLALVALAVAGRGLAPGAREKGAAALVAVVALGYSFYWYSGADFGARYWSQMIVPLAVLSAAFVARVDDPLLRRLVVVASLLGMPVVLVARGTIKYRDYRGMTPEMQRLADSVGFGRDLVLVRGQVFSDYSPGLIMNPPSLDGPGPLYFRSVAGDDLRELRDRFPDRQVWVVEGPSLTGGPPEVVVAPR